jgi:hypothetical protein
MVINIAKKVYYENRSEILGRNSICIIYIPLSTKDQKKQPHEKSAKSIEKYLSDFNVHILYR